MRVIREWVLSNWILMLVGALLTRLFLAPHYYGFPYDMDTFGKWGQALMSYPFSQFYAVAPVPDHLPGDLYLHAFLAAIFQAFGGENFLGGAYRFLLKAVPSLADLYVAGVIWLVIRRVAGEARGRLAALFYAWNPATIFLSGVWGQWDVVSGLIMLLGLGVVWLRPSRWLVAIPLLAWAVLIKPPLALLCIIGLLALPLTDLRRRERLVEIIRQRLGSVLAALVIGIGTIVLMILPFDTGLPGMGKQWSLVDRINVAIDLYQNTTLGAANIWMIPLRSPGRISDQDVVFLGLSAQAIGNILFGAALLYVGVAILLTWRKIEPMTITVWGMVTANYAYFLLPTRSHERYLFPAVMMIIVLWGCARPQRSLTWLAGAVSTAYFLNIMGVYLPLGGTTEDVWFVTVSIANILLFCVTATYPFWPREDFEEVEVAGTPMPVYADDYGPGLVMTHETLYME